MAGKWDDRPYAVGKGKTPVNTRFGQPGATTKRKTRKDARNADTVIKRALAKKIKLKSNGRDCTMTMQEAIVTQLINQAVSGQIRPIELVLRIIREIDASAMPEPERVPLSESDREILEQFAQALRGQDKGAE